MAYNFATDFLGLLRLTGGGVRTERMPGLDYVVAALQRMGLITLYTGQTAPTTNQASTVWIKPNLPSWTAEGVVYLWDSVNLVYAVATPALWVVFFAGIRTAYSFQSAAAANNNVLAGTTLLAVQRVAPVTTALVLPVLGAQFAKGVPIRIADFSTGVVNHTIAITTPDGATIMQSANWALLSTADSLAGILLYPSPDLNAWVIAP